MARDPWKRAYDRKRLAATAAPIGRRRLAAPPRRKSPAAVILLVLLLAVLAGAAYVAWQTRVRWLPQVRDELPPAVAEHVPVPGVEIDYAALELGVGRGLVLLGDYLDLIDGTREMEPEWQVLQTGPDTLRLESDGIRVYVKDSLIQTYTLEVPEFFGATQWQPWHREWRDAGIMPELTWLMFTGEEQTGGETERLYISPESVKRPDGWVHRAFNLQFHNGTLARLEGRLEFGPSAAGAGE